MPPHANHIFETIYHTHKELETWSQASAESSWSISSIISILYSQRVYWKILFCLILFVPFSIDSSSDSPGPSLCITPSTTLSKQCLNPTTTLSKQRLHPPSTPSKQCYHKQTALSKQCLHTPTTFSKQCLHTPTTFSKQCFFAGTVAGDAKHLGSVHFLYMRNRAITRSANEQIM